MIRVGIISEIDLPKSLVYDLRSSGELDIDSNSPDVFLIYCSSWNRSRLALVRNPAIILCHQCEEPFTTNSILRQQVAGVLQADAKPSEILIALQAAAAGFRILPGIRNHLVAYPLTRRELEILTLIADGEGNKSIADILQISQHTVKFHISSIFEKLHVSSRTEAVKAGIHHGLLSL
jgi:DNA-binding NarL/FixJ family response regulator